MLTGSINAFNSPPSASYGQQLMNTTKRGEKILVVRNGCMPPLISVQRQERGEHYRVENHAVGKEIRQAKWEQLPALLTGISVRWQSNGEPFLEFLPGLPGGMLKSSINNLKNLTEYTELANEVSRILIDAPVIQWTPLEQRLVITAGAVGGGILGGVAGAGGAALAVTALISAGVINSWNPVGWVSLGVGIAGGVGLLIGAIGGGLISYMATRSSNKKAMTVKNELIEIYSQYAKIQEAFARECPEGGNNIAEELRRLFIENKYIRNSSDYSFEIGSKIQYAASFYQGEGKDYVRYATTFLVLSIMAALPTDGSRRRPTDAIIAHFETLIEACGNCLGLEAIRDHCCVTVATLCAVDNPKRALIFCGKIPDSSQIYELAQNLANEINSKHPIIKKQIQNSNKSNYHNEIKEEAESNEIEKLINKKNR